MPWNPLFPLEPPVGIFLFSTEHLSIASLYKGLPKKPSTLLNKAAKLSILTSWSEAFKK